MLHVVVVSLEVFVTRSPRPIEEPRVDRVLFSGANPVMPGPTNSSLHGILVARGVRAACLLKHSLRNF